jgi:hypothetical protein
MDGESFKIHHAQKELAIEHAEVRGQMRVNARESPTQQRARRG